MFWGNTDHTKRCLIANTRNNSATFLTNIKQENTALCRQLVTCPTTDACLTANPGVTSSILAWFHTFVEIDHEIISRVILLSSADSFKKGCCQLQTKECAQSTG